MWQQRTEGFCRRFGLRVPILLAPMAGACPPALSIAVANAGGLGACGALLMQPDQISRWADEFRAASRGAFQFNLWIPDPAPARDEDHEASVRAFLRRWEPADSAGAEQTAAAAKLPDFEAQFDAIVRAQPPIVSSVMGVYPPPMVERLRSHGIHWFANVSTVAEALQAEAAGADVIVAQGMEAGGHRGCFDARSAEAEMVGLFALLPAVVDAVKVPVVATGGIADGRGVAAALTLGASAVQIGTGFLRCPEAGIASAWADALGRTRPEDTRITRAFSGRAGRSIATAYVRAAAAGDAPRPAPYPVQRALTAAMRADAQKHNDIDRMQAWAGQSCALASTQPAANVVDESWQQAQRLLK